RRLVAPVAVGHVHLFPPVARMLLHQQRERAVAVEARHVLVLHLRGLRCAGARALRQLRAIGGGGEDAGLPRRALQAGRRRQHLALREGDDQRRAAGELLVELAPHFRARPEQRRGARILRIGGQLPRAARQFVGDLQRGLALDPRRDDVLPVELRPVGPGLRILCVAGAGGRRRLRAGLYGQLQEQPLRGLRFGRKDDDRREQQSRHKQRQQTTHAPAHSLRPLNRSSRQEDGPSRRVASRKPSCRDAIARAAAASVVVSAAIPNHYHEVRKAERRPMHDLIIKDGLVVDGTGAPAFHADVAVADGRIVEVGEVTAPARRTIGADGMMVTPGFVDIHTHYDGQASWDQVLAPSSIHGVTSVAMGNCGVGFAPARADKHDWLIRLLEGVEDIPGTALAEGLSWDWESFPDYLDALSRRRYTMDVAAHVPNAALRAYVMGERGADHTAAPTDDEIERMSVLT